MTKKIKKDNQEVSKLQKQIDEMAAGWKRTQADFDNYRRRSEEQKFQLVELAKAGFMSKLTPVLDNFRRAFSHIPKEIQHHDWTKGINQIEKQLFDILAEEGLKRIETKGAKFNPALHEAVSYEKNSRVAADHIIDECESGWVFGGKVIKCAKVRVSRGNDNE